MPYAYRRSRQAFVFVVIASEVFCLKLPGIKTYFSTNTFDVDKMKDAAKLFLGFHDFRSFMGKASLQPDKVTRRILDRLDIAEVPSTCYSSYSWPFCMSINESDYKFLDIYIKAKGFLYRQVSYLIKS